MPKLKLRTVLVLANFVTATMLLLRICVRTEYYKKTILAAEIATAEVATVAEKSPRTHNPATENPSTINNDYARNRSAPDRNLTVVTAFFDLGKFEKGIGEYFHPLLYQQWMTVFRLINNNLVVYVDRDENSQLLQRIRANFSASTQIITLNRTEMWSFGLVRNISEIFHQPRYPRYNPNTVVPEYSAAMQAKYEVVEMAIRSNPFGTRYFCWLDIGLFRELLPSEELFSLDLPPNFIDDAVAVNEVEERSPDASPLEINCYNLVWIGGGVFIARSDVMLKFIQEYKSAVDWLLSLKLINTDQQVIYSLLNRADQKPKTKFNIYKCDGRHNVWFHLAYLCREMGMRTTNGDYEHYLI